MKTNFRKIIKALQNAGYSKAALSREVGCSAVYIGHLASGQRKQPGYDLGKRLIGLYEAI